jgi:hypothetical protein
MEKEQAIFVVKKKKKKKKKKKVNVRRNPRHKKCKVCIKASD